MRNTQLKVFVAEKEEYFKDLLMSKIEAEGHKVVGYESSEECIRFLNKKPDLVLVGDLQESSSNAMDVVYQIKAESPETQVVIMSKKESLELAVRALKNGATDFLVKDGSILTRVGTVLHKVERTTPKRSGFGTKIMRYALPTIGASAFASVLLGLF